MTIRPLTVPQLSLGDDEVVVVAWLLAPGDAFADGDPLLEIETDKAAMQVEAPFDGVLARLVCEPGDTLAVGAVIGYAVDPGADIVAALAALADDPQPATVVRAPAASHEVAPPAAWSESAGTEYASSPAFVSVEHGELAGLPAARPTHAPAAVLPPPSAHGPALPLDDRDAAGPYRERPLSRRRAAIARRMAAAAAIPTFAVLRDIPAAPGLSAVARARAAGQDVTFTDLLLRACALAAHAHPVTNAWFVDGIVLEFEHVGIALAVDTPEGVVAPVLPKAEALDLADVAAIRADLVTRARSGKLQARELAGATITLSNIGGLGAHLLTPSLTAPQVAVLGVGAARALPDDDVVGVTFVGDHRVLDGADGANFLATLANGLQTIIDA